MADFNNGLAVNGPLTISDEATTNIHFGAIVKAVIDDCSRHTDGGAWRKRCSDKSWFTEALGGEVWIGQQASIAAAWSAANSLPGAVFQATATAGPLTSGKFYVATSATAATEVFRGISRDYPDTLLWVAETARVVGYDLTKPGCPMWMVFKASSDGLINIAGSGVVTSIVSSNGLLVIGTSTRALTQANFVSDSGYIGVAATHRALTAPMGLIRNVGNVFPNYCGSTAVLAIVNQAVNDVAVTVLDTAPTDPATGLPVPTIAVATAGGTSIIQNDGTVVTAGTYTTNASKSVTFFGDMLIGSLVASTHLVYWKITTGAFLFEHYFGIFPSPMPSSNAHLCVGRAAGSVSGFEVWKDSPSTPTKGMVTYITNAYNSGWQVGDSRGAYLSDTTAETIAASGELVTNGTFTTDTSGWSTSALYASTAAAVAGEMQVTVSVGFGRQMSAITCVVGKTYRLQGSARVVSGTSRAFVGVGSNSAGTSATTAVSTFSASALGFSLDFVATATTMYVTAGDDANVSGGVLGFDNISIKLADADRSVKNTGLVLNGTLTKTAVASGAGLVAYSGFSANTNYLSQPYSANLDFGTGDFAFGFWTDASAAGVMFTRGNGTSAGSIMWYQNGGGLTAALYIHDGTSLAARLTVTLPSGLSNIWITRLGTTLSVYSNGALLGTATSALTVSNATAVLQIGNRQDASQTYGGWVSLFRASATAPSADQIAYIYRTELPLFQANAQCTIAGTSTAVTALAYDDVADTLQVGTSWGRTSFRDLLRIDSEATSTGAITSLSANEGVVLTGGASSGKVYAPAMYLRDELRRKDVARKALGRVPAFFDYTATASQTAFVAPKGFTVKALYKNGTLMRETTTGVYWTRSTDGFQETATLSVGATVSDWISLMCVRV